MKKIISIIFFLTMFSNLFAQIPGSPLKVSGNVIRDNNNSVFTLKAINFNDYMECAYNAWGRYYNQNFSTIVSWLHTSDDYTRVKRMGFNTVRVNISPAHLDSFPNMARLIQHIQWAKKDSLYVILGYFAPPGSDSLAGYYTEKNFYTSEVNKNKFRQQWGKIMKLCKDSNYTHVLYEFLNEPQIGYVDNENYPNLSAYWKRSIYKDLMVNLLDTMARIGDANRVVIINGLSYASTDYRGYKYLKTAINRNNIVYSFHYYMPDFAFRGCNWNLGNPYTNFTGYTQNNNSWDTLSFVFNTTHLQGTTQPQIVLSPHDQRGTYRIKYFEIKENSTQQIKLSLDLANKQLIPDGLAYYILDGTKRFYLGFHGTWGSADSSNMYIHNNTSIAMTNTVKQDTGVTIGNFNWSAMVYSNSPSTFSLTPGQNYTFKIIMDGDSLEDNGGFSIQFKSNDVTVVYQKDIQNLTYGNTSQIEKILSSHKDRIDAAFISMKKFSNEFNVPIFLGEFGIPILQREPNTYSYFRNIMNNIDANNFSWAYFVYREPNPNDVPESTSYITLGLFSGNDLWNNPTATVCKIVNGINIGTTSSTLGPPFKYYYNKFLIDTLKNILGGTFSTTCTTSELQSNSTTIPVKYSLEQNFPNPFNPLTTIRYSLPKENFVTIIVYDILGNEIQALVSENQKPGNYSVTFDASTYPSGVYYYKILSNDFTDTKKMILIK